MSTCHLPTAGNNYFKVNTLNILFRQDVQFERNYDKEPIVIITARHNSEGNNLKAIHISVATWIEV